MAMNSCGVGGMSEQRAGDMKIGGRERREREREREKERTAKEMQARTR